MKKIMSLFFVITLIFLTACNTTPPVNSSSSESSGDQPDNSLTRDEIVAHGSGNFINLPSRVMFSMSIGDGIRYNVYYSKVDGKVYPCCYDPLCDHLGGKCLAAPRVDMPMYPSYIVHFLNNRFYVVSETEGKIYSYNFDGTDVKIEYDSGYDREFLSSLSPISPWSLQTLSYGDYIYIYIDAKFTDDGKEHLLRFNIISKEMEDLTEKTGNYIQIRFIYNGEIYGTNRFDGTPTFQSIFLKSDIDLKNVTELERDELETSLYFSGSLFFRRALGENNEQLGIQIHDIKTGQTTIIPKETLGMAEDATIEIACVDENYVYYYNSKKIVIGYKELGSATVPITINEGKLYRMNQDGTNPTCIFDNPAQSIDGSYCIVFDNTIIIKAQDLGIQDGVTQIVNSGYYVGAIGEDGTIGELKLVEFVG